MKKVLSVFLISVITIFPQTNNKASLLSARNDIRETIKVQGTADKTAESLQPAFSKKSAGLAILYSLLLPGMGELYADSYSSGKYFTIAEGVLWGTYIGINTYGNWQKDRYIAFAASRAGVNTSGKDDKYFSIISENPSIYVYNNQKALERNFHEMYDEQKYFWTWNEQDRKSYRSMWVSSEQSFNNLRFVVGALLLNRLASAINAVRLVSAYNKRASTEMGWNVSVGVVEEMNIPSGLSLNFQTSF